MEYHVSPPQKKWHAIMISKLDLQTIVSVFVFKLSFVHKDKLSRLRFGNMRHLILTDIFHVQH